MKHINNVFMVSLIKGVYLDGLTYFSKDYKNHSSVTRDYKKIL